MLPRDVTNFVLVCISLLEPCTSYQVELSGSVKKTFVPIYLVVMFFSTLGSNKLRLLFGYFVDSF